MRMSVLAGWGVAVAAAVLVTVSLLQQRSTGSPAAVGVLPDAALNASAEAVAVGSPAPDFRLNDQDGNGVQLHAVTSDSWALVAFYPKASSPG